MNASQASRCACTLLEIDDDRFCAIRGQDRFAADSPLEGEGFELLVPC
jgi:hypothetical protein